MKTIKINYIKLLLFSGLMGVFTACDQDFLDKDPLDKISGATFWKSEGDVKMALTGVYTRLQNGFFGHRKLWLDTYSDNAYDRHSYYDFEILTQGIVNSTNVTSTFYNAPYEGISACNYFLANIDRAPIGEEVKMAYKAEVRFLRAFFYFDLVQSFGGVIVYETAPETVDDAKQKQATKEETLKFIHDDLDFAVANLPDEAYTGHAVKASAQAIKARVFMLEQKWPEAAALTKEIITGKKFSIYQGGYQNLFLTSTQQGNPEIIFSTKYLGPNNPQGNEGILVEIGWYGCIQPYQDLVDEYEMKNGKMINEPGSEYDPNNPYSNRDPRLGLSIRHKEEVYYNPDGSIYPVTDAILTGYVQEKYMDFTLLPWDRSKITQTDMNIVHVRYADVLLMYAEAQNEASGPDASIYDALDEIRSRAGIEMPPIDRSAYSDQDKLRAFIRHERRVELALEGHRYFDLKRWNLMEERLSDITNPAGVQLKFGEIDNKLPFPLNELDKNPQLVQNDGY